MILYQAIVIVNTHRGVFAEFTSVVAGLL